MAAEVDRSRRLGADATERLSHVEILLPGPAPIIAATDYVRAYPQLIAPFVTSRFVALGTDGFGRSDSRAALRSFFDVDRVHIVLAALEALVREGTLERTTLLSAIEHFGVKTEAPAPWKV